MKKILYTVVGAIYAMAFNGGHASAQEKAAPTSIQVHVVITDMGLQTDSEIPRLTKDDVGVKQGKTTLQVTQLIPAQGDQAALQLMILIDDTMSSAGNNLNNLADIKDFIKSQPATTVIGIGYMSNAGVNVVQNFTADHDLAIKAIRLPLSRVSTMDSPYLSLINLVKGWQKENVRREVLILSDGIDRLRGETPRQSQFGPNFGGAYHSMPIISPDVQSASEVCQRYNVLVYSIFTTGIGRVGRSSWDAQLGLSGLTKIADETGGECYNLGTTNLVSFKPYLERFQKALDNQYYLVFLAVPKKKAGFQRVNVQTEAPKSEILAPDNVWVESPAQ
jgi:hypothetical protein